MRLVKPGDFGRRTDAVIARATGDSTADDTMELPLLRGERLAGRVLTRLVVSIGLLTALIAIAAAALAWLGIWEPLVVAVTLVVLAALSWRVSALVPTRALPVWSALALLVISVGATTWAGLTHAEQLLPRGAAGVHAQAAVALAQRHQWPISLSANEFGGPQVLRIPGLTIGSQGFRQIGPAAEPGIEPQALIGAPAWFSLGFWVGGVATMLWVTALFGGLVVLAIGLLTSSVVGPRWGPLGALAAAICFPVLQAARATSPDLLVVFVLCSGLLLLVAATRAGARGHWQQARAVGFLAGALVASGSLFRVDAMGYSALLLPVAALLIIRRDGAGTPVLWGAVSTTALSALGGHGLSDGLFRKQGNSWIPLGLLAVGCFLLAVVMIASARRGARVPDGIRASLPRFMVALTMVGGLALVALPSRQGLSWTSWWTGPYALAITMVVVAVGAHHLTRAWFRGEPLPAWTGALIVGLAAAFLGWLPPTGSRATPGLSGGLVLVVPLVIVCVAAGVAWLTRWSKRRLPTVGLVVASVGAAATLLVPAAASTWPHAGERVSQGQVAAVQQVCRAFGPGDVALMVDDRAADEWLPTVRANCDVPALSLTLAARADPADGGEAAAAVASVARAVNAHGGRLVLMAGGSVGALAGLATATTRIGTPVAAVNGTVTQDPQPVAGRPGGLSLFRVQVWLAAVGQRP